MPKSIEKSSFHPPRIKNFSSSPPLHRPSHPQPFAATKNFCINYNSLCNVALAAKILPRLQQFEGHVEVAGEGDGFASAGTHFDMRFAVVENFYYI